MYEFIILVQLFTAPVVAAYYLIECCNLFSLYKTAN